MAKQVSLTVEGINKRQKKGITKLYSDAGARGLYLKTTKSKTASWIFRWRDRGTNKLRDLGLGSVNEVTLKEARENAGDLRKITQAGEDPIVQRNRERQEHIAAAAKAQTFQQVAEAYYAAKLEPTGLTDKHKNGWQSRMNHHVYPTIGGVLVKDIDINHVHLVLQPIWSDSLDTAKKTRQSMEKVLTYAKVAKLRTGENPARWKDNLDALLAKPKDVRKAKPVTHRKALPWKQINPFVAELRQREGMAARALEFVVLTATRSGQTTLMTWDELDLENSLWIIPAERMLKNEKQHTVPLSKLALKLLKALPRRDASPYVFWAPRGGALTDMSLLEVLRRMEVDATVHGFRSTFKDWCRSFTVYADEVSELALSHVNSDATRAAYARDELIPKRTLMMRDWAKYIERKPTQDANVTSINKATA